MRKIIHCDMDAFYASVEQRDDPRLRGKPVIVAWKGNLSVVCAASYEARAFGVRSAIPAKRAERLCPEGIFVAPDFTRYRPYQTMCVRSFTRHTDLIEPLSLDEAYVHVTTNKAGLPHRNACGTNDSRTDTKRTELTASAGSGAEQVPGKIASDWKKPDGLFVI